MIKLTRYTSIEDLKASKDSSLPQKSISEQESELKEFVSLLMREKDIEDIKQLKIQKSDPE